MNDFSEVAHGLECLIKSYGSSVGKDLNAALDECHPGISNEVAELFNTWIPTFRYDTFAISFSEHLPEEDTYGRLSMWRAYGGDSGIALILNGGVLLRPSSALAAYSSPVAYLDADGVAQELVKIKEGILRNIRFVQSLKREHLKQIIFNAFRYAAICTKHPAFKEEHEWRVVANPSFHNNPRLNKSIEIIGGIPQKVIKIELKDYPNEGLYGLQPPDFIERVMIGPCQYPSTLQQSLVTLMESAGIDKPYEKIMVTGIPLRPNQR